MSIDYWRMACMRCFVAVTLTGGVLLHCFEVVCAGIGETTLDDSTRKTPTIAFGWKALEVAVADKELSKVVICRCWGKGATKLLYGVLFIGC